MVLFSSEEAADTLTEHDSIVTAPCSLKSCGGPSENPASQP